MANYKDIYESWKLIPLKFWKNQTNDILWVNKPTNILDDNNKPFYKWFSDGVLNTCFNAVAVSYTHLTLPTTPYV